jgi:hypothetical protein
MSDVSLFYRIIIFSFSDFEFVLFDVFYQFLNKCMSLLVKTNSYLFKYNTTTQPKTRKIEATKRNKKNRSHQKANTEIL